MGCAPLGLLLLLGSILLGPTLRGLIHWGYVILDFIHPGSVLLGFVLLASVSLGSEPVDSVHLSPIILGSAFLGSIPLGPIFLGYSLPGFIHLDSVPLDFVLLVSVIVGSVPIGSALLGLILSGFIHLSAVLLNFVLQASVALMDSILPGFIFLHIFLPFLQQPLLQLCSTLHRGGHRRPPAPDIFSRNETVPLAEQQKPRLVRVRAQDIRTPDDYQPVHGPRHRHVHCVPHPHDAPPLRPILLH